MRQYLKDKIMIDRVGNFIIAVTGLYLIRPCYY